MTVTRTGYFAGKETSGNRCPFIAARAPPTVDQSPWDRPLSFSGNRCSEFLVLWHRSERVDTEVRKSDTNCATSCLRPVKTSDARKPLNWRRQKVAQ